MKKSLFGASIIRSTHLWGSKAAPSDFFSLCDVNTKIYIEFILDTIPYSVFSIIAYLSFIHTLCVCICMRWSYVLMSSISIPDLNIYICN